MNLLFIYQTVLFKKISLKTFILTFLFHVFFVVHLQTLMMSAGIPFGVNYPHKLHYQHILEVGMFNKDQLHAVFQWADIFRMCVARETPIEHILKGKVMARYAQ